MNHCIHLWLHDSLSTGKQLQHCSIFLDTLHYWGPLAFFVPGEKPTGKTTCILQENAQSIAQSVYFSTHAVHVLAMLDRKNSRRGAHPLMHLRNSAQM